MPESIESLVIALLVIVPGFIAATTWARARTWRGPSSDLRTVLQSLALSAILQVALAPITLYWIFPIRDELAKHPRRVGVFLLLAVLVVPVASGRIAALISDWKFNPRLVADEGEGRISQWFTKMWTPQAPPSIWDWLFTGRPPHGMFLVIQFASGRRVAGVFSKGSMAMTSPEPQGLFLVQEWSLDGNGDLIGPIPGSQGVMIASMTAVESIRILEGGTESG